MDLSKLEGLIEPETGEALARLAAAIPEDQAIVEIGSYKGKSTCYLAQGAKGGEGAQVYAVDPWDSDGNESGRFGFAKSETREAFDAQVKRAGLRRQIIPVQGFSVDVAEDWTGKDVGLLFIDGDHSEESVTDDFHAWERYLVPGESVVVFDDYRVEHRGVITAVDNLAKHHFSHSKTEAPGLFRAVYEG